ncbi:MAG TPA: carbohydrate kinase family protein [Clostridia bacterium]|nr:carbohydrate kinase family protein [Clostridia bacterium]
MKKEEAKIGKIKTDPKITLIGACNLDLQGISSQDLKLYDSNPGKLTTSAGGVARNIAENIARLGLSTRLLTTLGKDKEGDFIRSSTEKLGVDMQDSLYLENTPSSVYLSILDKKGELVVAINQMGILEKLNKEYLQEKKELIKESPMIVLDANLQEEVIDYLCKNHQDQRIFVDPVSTVKSLKLKNSLKYLYAIKPNIYEMQSLLGRKLSGFEDYKKALYQVLELGVKEVYLTLGQEGVLVADKNQIIHASAQVENVKSVTGAGDAFLAAAVYANYHGWDLEHLASFSQALALIVLGQQRDRVYFEEEKIRQRRKDVKTKSLLW